MAQVRKLGGSQGCALFTEGRLLIQGSPEPATSGAPAGWKHVADRASLHHRHLYYYNQVEVKHKEPKELLQIPCETFPGIPSSRELRL